MKVRCINEKGWEYTDKKWWQFWKQGNYGPKFGDVVTVVDHEWVKGSLYYFLLECPDNADSYSASEFEPIEEQYDKVSFEQIKEKASVN